MQIHHFWYTIGVRNSTLFSKLLAT